MNYQHGNVLILRSQFHYCTHTAKTHRNKSNWTAVIEVYSNYVIVSPIIVIPGGSAINCAALVKHTTTQNLYALINSLRSFLYKHMMKPAVVKPPQHFTPVSF